MKTYRIVTIEREYASGGSAVAQKLGERLDLPVYGRELLRYLERHLNLPAENMEAFEETPTNSLLYSLHLIGQLYRGEAPEGAPQDKLKQAEQDLIRHMADQRPCVLLGRAASWALRARKDVLNVFITADEAFRIDRAISEYGIAEAKAKATLAKFDRRRAGYYREMTGQSWQEKAGYHMVLDSSKLGIESCMEILAGVYEAGR